MEHLNEFEKQSALITIKHVEYKLRVSLEESSKFSKIISFSYEYVVVDKYLFSLAYMITDNKFFNHGYRMEVRSIYGVNVLYSDENVIGSKAFTLEDVKSNCKNYFNSYANDFNKILK